MTNRYQITAAEPPRTPKPDDMDDSGVCAQCGEVPGANTACRSCNYTPRATVNSFQKWAREALRNAGIHTPVVLVGNWVEVDGKQIMTVDGINRFIRSNA